nr:uncharacterized mitochondrial protein AtMg00810-like [Tanacetum cinerariifolium]
EVYVCQPPGFEDPNFPDKVYKVEKALYGLHQALRAWYETLSTYLLDNGFHRGQIDKTLFIKRHKDNILLVQVYVDDIIFGSPKKDLSTEFEKLMHDKFQISSMGELSFFLELQVKQKSDGIFISQDKYMAEILKKFDFVTVKTASTPMKLVIAKDGRCFVDTSKVTTRNTLLSTAGLTTVGQRLMLPSIKLQLMVLVNAAQGYDKSKKKVNDQEQIQALVDKKKAIITEDNIRSDLYFDDAEGTACLLNEVIFEGLTPMGAKTTAWNEFSSTMASAIIRLADNQKFNFSKHKEMYVISSHTKKIFANMRRIRAGFSKVVTPIFDTMMVLAAADMGDTLVETHQTPIVYQPSTSRPQKKQNPKRKQRKEAEVSHDESKDVDHVPTPSSDPLPSGEDSYTLNELMVFCTSLQEQGRKNDDEMFRVDDISGEEVVLDTTTGEHEEQIVEDVSTAEPVNTASEVVTTIADKIMAAPTTDVIKDEITMSQALAALKSTKPKVVVQEQEMSTTIPAAATNEKGKAKMIEPEVPIKKKDQMRMDEKYVRQLEAKEKEAARLSRAQQDEEANISWDNTQAMMKADSLLAERLQAREREEFSEVQKARLLKQKVDENVKPVIDDTEELKKCMEIVPNDGDEVLIEATPTSSRSSAIIDYKIHKEGNKNYFKIIRADGNSQVYQTFEKMFKNFNREDVEVLWAIVKDRFKNEKPMDDMDNLLFRTLKTMFEHHVEDTIWTYQQGLAKVKNWKLFESCGVYCITMQSTIYYLLVEKVYTLTRNTLHQLWSDVRLQVD